MIKPDAFSESLGAWFCKKDSGSIFSYLEGTMAQSNIIMYTTEDGVTKIEVTFDHDTVWLSIDQMAELFQRDKSVIGKHVRNIFKEGELVKEAVWAKFAYTASQ